MAGELAYQVFRVLDPLPLDNHASPATGKPAFWRPENELRGRGSIGQARPSLQIQLDTFVQGVGRIEEVSAGLFRVSYFAYQRGYEGLEKICVAKFIVTADTMVAMAQSTGSREAADRLLGKSHSPMN